jgi:hypothetical protein
MIQNKYNINTKAENAAFEKEGFVILGQLVEI